VFCQKERMFPPFQLRSKASSFPLFFFLVEVLKVLFSFKEGELCKCVSVLYKTFALQVRT